MSLYVEVMCDERKEWGEANRAKGPLVNRCLTNRGDNPQGGSVAIAKKAAKDQGWIVRGNYACCPHCQKEPTLRR